MIKKIILIAFSFLFLQNMLMAQQSNTDDTYFSRMQKKIERNWIVPLKSNNKSTVVAFSVDSTGKVIDAKLVRSSGDDDFDKSALNAIYKAVPFEAFSEDMQSSLLNFEFFFSNNSTGLTQLDESIDTITGDKPAVDNVSYTSYVRNLQQRVTSNWVQAPYYEDKSTILLFKIKKDGSVEDLQVVKPSGDSSFDNAVLSAFNNSLPLDCLPSESSEDFMQVEFSFFYTVLKDDTGNQYKTSCLLVNNKASLADDYENYQNEVEAVLAGTVTNPRYYWQMNRKISLKLTLNEDGKLASFNITKSSGDFSFDNRILSALQKCSFPAIPSSLNKKNIELNYSVKTQNDKSIPIIINSCAYFWGKILVPTYDWQEF